MDIIYCPAPVSRLPVDLVAELCELRLAMADQVIVQSTHSAVADAVIGMAMESVPTATRILDFGTGTADCFRSSAGVSPAPPSSALT